MQRHDLERHNGVNIGGVEGNWIGVQDLHYELVIMEVTTRGAAGVTILISTSPVDQGAEVPSEQRL